MNVFVYGTLRPGQSNHGLIADAVLLDHPAVAHDLALHTAPHAGFPYAVPMPGASTYGTLLQIEPGAAEMVLGRLDRLEGYQPANEVGSHYLRRRRTVVLNGPDRPDRPGLPGRHDRGQSSVSAWLYIAAARVARRLSTASLIPGGDWASRPITRRGV